MLKEIYTNAEHKMDVAIEHLVHTFGTLRTGRASTALVEEVEVEAYGAKQQLKAVATIGTPDARTIMIQPWDRSLVHAVEKALQIANLGMNPSSDGNAIRLLVPSLTEERRKDIVKEAHKHAEEARVAVRNVRRHAIDEAKKLEKDKSISEDDLKKAEKHIQEITDGHVKRIDEKLKQKEGEIMEV
jgi:ribosome recycling factor